MWQTDYVYERNTTSYSLVFYAYRRSVSISLSGRCTLVSSRRPLLVDDADSRLFFSFSSLRASLTRVCFLLFSSSPSSSSPSSLSLVCLSTMRTRTAPHTEREMWRHSIIRACDRFSTWISLFILEISRLYSLRSKHIYGLYSKSDMVSDRWRTFLSFRSDKLFVTNSWDSSFNGIWIEEKWPIHSSGSRCQRWTSSIGQSKYSGH